jgi:hypothetical protein
MLSLPEIDVTWQPATKPGSDRTGSVTVVQDLVVELLRLHADAGRPSYRRISAEIRRQNDMPDTLSHETVSALLRGDTLPRWSKVECVVRCLAAMAVHRPDQEAKVRRFHALWLDAADRERDSAPSPDRSTITPAKLVL